MLFKVHFHALHLFDSGVLLHFVHDLYDDIEGLGCRISIEAYFELIVVILFGVFEDIIKDGGHHFADNSKRKIEIVLIPKQPHDNFFGGDILIPIDIFRIMISNEGSIHAPNFELESIFDKGSPYQVVVLSLKTLEVTSHRCYRVIFV